ncbi:MAG: glycosyltransferase, partial [Anaerolineae bacterium]|nr:glycosyltransferase [Anaerolineae bacterium]
SQVEAQVAALDLGERFILTGLRRDVPELMAAFDIFVLTSLWEGLPRVLPQAMATGLPIVATAIDGNAEAVTDGVSGRLVPPDRPDRVAQAVIDLLSDRELMARMGVEGKNRVGEFGAQQMVDQITDLYQQLLRQKGL